MQQIIFHFSSAIILLGNLYRNMNSPFFNFEIFSDAVFRGAWSENTGFKGFLRFILFVLFDLAKMSTQLNLNTLSHSQTTNEIAMRKYFWCLNSLNVVRSFQSSDDIFFLGPILHLQLTSYFICSSLRF